MIAIIAVLLAIIWCVQTALVVLHISQTKILYHADPVAPVRWPRVSVIIPACNEENWIATALDSRLADDYPDIEIIIVDDRSTDTTPTIIAETTSKDPRVRSIRVDDLPEGWLGKVYALQMGTLAATGEWLQFSDGDALINPRMLAKAIGYCEANGVDVLAVAPEFHSKSRVIYAIYPVTLRFMWMVVRPQAVSSPKSKVVIGSGAVNYSALKRRASDQK